MSRHEKALFVTVADLVGLLGKMLVNQQRVRKALANRRWPGIPLMVNLHIYLTKAFSVSVVKSPVYTDNIKATESCVPV